MIKDTLTIVISCIEKDTKLVCLFKKLMDPVIVAALLALFGIGKQLTNKNITEERQKWLTQLKINTSVLMSLINNKIKKNFDEKDEKVHKDEKDLKEVYYNIYFNLNTEDDMIDKPIIELMEKIIENINDVKYMEEKKNKCDLKEDNKCDLKEDNKCDLKEDNKCDLKEDIERLESYFSNMFKFEWERIKIETGWRSYLPFIGTYSIKKKVRDLKNETATKMKKSRE